MSSSSDATATVIDSCMHVLDEPSDTTGWTGGNHADNSMAHKIITLERELTKQRATACLQAEKLTELKSNEAQLMKAQIAAQAEAAHYKAEAMRLGAELQWYREHAATALRQPDVLLQVEVQQQRQAMAAQAAEVQRLRQALEEQAAKMQEMDQQMQTTQALAMAVLADTQAQLAASQAAQCESVKQTMEARVQCATQINLRMQQQQAMQQSLKASGTDRMQLMGDSMAAGGGPHDVQRALANCWVSEAELQAAAAEATRRQAADPAHTPRLQLGAGGQATVRVVYWRGQWCALKVSSREQGGCQGGTHAWCHVLLLLLLPRLMT